MISLALGAQTPEPFNEDVKYSNPRLRIWIQVKAELLGPDGSAYLQAVQSGPFPAMNAEVVSVSGRNELLVSGRLPKMLSKPGAKICFAGNPAALRKKPFQLTSRVDAAKIELDYDD